VSPGDIRRSGEVSEEQTPKYAFSRFPHEVYETTTEAYVTPMEIIGALNIPLSELSFSFSRSSGPGGQNVNKVNTRVTLAFDVAHSPSLDGRQRQLIADRLAARINKHGVLRIAADSCRTQAGNRQDVILRFITLLRQALHEERPRRKTRVPKRVRERRLSVKKNRGRLKQLRSRKVTRHE